MWQLAGEHNPFRMWGFAWSPDDDGWQDLPWKVPRRGATFAQTMRPSEAREKAIAKALAEGRDEPIGHELLREALFQVDDNPGFSSLRVRTRRGNSTTPCCVS